MGYNDDNEDDADDADADTCNDDDDDDDGAVSAAGTPPLPPFVCCSGCSFPSGSCLIVSSPLSCPSESTEASAFSSTKFAISPAFRLARNVICFVAALDPWSSNP